MRKMKRYLVASLSVSLLTSGCATAGGISSGGSSSQLSNTVYQTHRMVQNMEQNLSGSVTTLTRTTAEIAARLDTRPAIADMIGRVSGKPPKTGTLPLREFGPRALASRACQMFDRG